ncbi:hypothetical protein GCM10010413_49070 [Promicromonospora sukumoe]
MLHRGGGGVKQRGGGGRPGPGWAGRDVRDVRVGRAGMCGSAASSCAGRPRQDVRFYPVIGPENTVSSRPNDWAEAHIVGGSTELRAREHGGAERSSTEVRNGRGT